MASRFTRGEIRKILGDAHTEEIENQLIALHLGVVDPMKDDLERYKAEAGEKERVQKELDALKGGEDWKGRYEKEHKALEDYKSEVAGREASQKVRSAYRAMLEGLNIGKEDVDLIMAATKTDDMKLDKDGKLEKESELTASAKEKYARYIPTTTTKGAKVETAPKDGNATLTRADIYAKDDRGRYKLSTAERQKALVEHPELMQRSE